MNGPLVSVFLPSYNKPAYVRQALKSVFSQTYENWELWILENSDDGRTRESIEPLLRPARNLRVIYEEIEYTPERRKQVYPTAELLNKYYPWAQGKYIFYLSDDDLFDPECLEHCVALMEAGQYDACWFSMRFVDVQGPDTGPFPDGPAEGYFNARTFIPADRVLGKGYDYNVNCRVDGGQVVHKKTCLDVLSKPYFQEEYTETTRNCDGLFLEKLSAHFSIFPVQRYLGTHRYTPLSTWTSL